MSEVENLVAETEAGRVGSFWIFGGCLLAEQVPLAQAEERGNRLDSPLGHVTVWPRLVARHRREMPMLAVRQYDEVPRGRVFYDVATLCFVVYMDSSLFTDTAADSRADTGAAG
jgi:hypothetical protein